MANGEDLLFVEINTLDENDTFVANSRSRVQVHVSGAGRLIGLDNGDSTDFDSYKGTSRRLFSGRLLAIIAAKDTPGTIDIEVTSKGLTAATLSIPAISCDVRDGISCFMENKESAEDLTDEIPVRKIELTNHGTNHFDENVTETTVTAKILPADATYREIEFKAVTLDGVESNSVKIETNGTEATIHALGDGEFRLCCSCKNGRDVMEVMSELEFCVTGARRGNFKSI